MDSRSLMAFRHSAEGARFNDCSGLSWPDVELISRPGLKGGPRTRRQGRRRILAKEPPSERVSPPGRRASRSPSICRPRKSCGSRENRGPTHSEQRASRLPPRRPRANRRAELPASEPVGKSASVDESGRPLHQRGADDPVRLRDAESRGAGAASRPRSDAGPVEPRAAIEERPSRPAPAAAVVGG